MNNYLLTRVRLTTYFVLFLILFLFASFLSPKFKLDGAALTLFSVNSFLYGFYIAPVLSAQKSRIEDLHRIIRSEANALFALVLKMKKMPKDLRNQLQDMVKEYIRTKTRARRPDGGEVPYENLISFCIEYKGEDQESVDKLLDALVSNQQNRTNLSMQLSNKVYSNEWAVMIILFSITLSFILIIDVGESITLNLVRALLCTGLTMLIVNLVKLSTLTHKKAKEMWDPLNKLVKTNFYRID